MSLREHDLDAAMQRLPLTECDGCVYDAFQLAHSHGFESLDRIGREAFVNHIHLNGADRIAVAQRIVDAWIYEMHAHWPDYTFRIYRFVEPFEVTIRFHVVRTRELNWCEGGEEGLEIIEVAT